MFQNKDASDAPPALKKLKCRWLWRCSAAGNTGSVSKLHYWSKSFTDRRYGFGTEHYIQRSVYIAKDSLK